MIHSYIHAQQKEESMRFIKENTVFGYKKWWKTISIQFPKSSEAIHITFSTNLYRVHWQGEFTLDGSLFVRLSREITKKKRKYRFKLQKRVKMGIFFFRGGVCRPFWKVINIFACTCPNRSGVGSVDNPDRFEQVFDPYYILEVPEKIFTHDISMVRRQKMLIFGVLKAFISKFTYYNLY